jgi:hypothetical protein
VAWLNAEYEDFPGGPCVAPDNVIPGCQANIGGEDLPFAPDWGGNVDLRYESVIGGYNFRADLGIVARGDLYVHPTLFAESEQDTYAKVNLRVEIADDAAGWSLALVGKNLNDEDTISYAFETPASAPPGATPDYGTVTQLVDIGRTVALQAGYRF